MIFDTMKKYYQFSDTRKELFRLNMVSSGTAACVAEASRTDLTEEPCIMQAYPYVMMLHRVEESKEYNFANGVTAGESRKRLDDIVGCTRETVRFFHKRNSCDCLKQLYYMLKESTKRTAECWNCRNIVDIRKLSRCDGCSKAQFCSYECAVAHWPKHKEECKFYQTKSSNETKL